MKLFLSWSGPISHKIATIFRDWIPLVLQSVEPYVSSEDIDKGTRWSSDIAKELEESRYGIIFVTHQNLEAPWINFEAGALSKTIEKANVAPFLFNIKRSEVDGPLLQFQLTIYDKEDIKKLISSMNNASDGSILSQPKLDRIFNQWWPVLEENLAEILKECEAVSDANKAPNQKEESLSHSNDKILEELLELARLQVKILKNPEELLPPKYLSYVFRESSLKSPKDKGVRALKDAYSIYRHLRQLSREIILENNSEDNIEKIKNILDIIRDMGGPIEYAYRHIMDRPDIYP